MAIVETLEIRFRANLGNLGAQIAAVTAALAGMGTTSSMVLGAVTGAALLAGRSMDRVSLSARTAEKRQTKLAAKLKKTGHALRSVSTAAKQAAEGIGLHKMDEVNLVGGQEKEKVRAPRKSSATDFSGAGSGLEKLKEMFEKLPGFFERIYNGVRKGMRGFDGWLDKATGGLAGNFAKLMGTTGRNAALSLVDRLLGTLNTSRPQLAEKGRSLLTAVCDALRNGALTTSAPTQAGSDLAGKLANGILGGRSGAQSAALSVTLAAKFGGSSAKSEAESAGKNLSKGFESGLLSYLDKIKNAAAKLAKAAIDKLKSLLKIASPSKVTFAMGGFFAEGFAGGIMNSASMARDSARMLANGAVTALNAGNMHLGGEASLSGMVRAAVTIPLNVDGIRLGEASIRGINRVTRASGRLMLEI